MAGRIAHTKVGGFAALRLDNDRLSLTVIPGLGGKIWSLKDLHTGRDWLWHNPVLPLTRPGPGMSYDAELDSGGWDEILFSVKPCSVASGLPSELSVPDHGFAVRHPWTVEDCSSHEHGDVSCRMSIGLEHPAFRFTRTIRLDPEHAVITLEYRLENTGRQRWPWLWAAHPLLDVGAGLHIDLPRGLAMTVEPSVLNGHPGTSLRWPMSTDDVDLSQVLATREAEGAFCGKFFVRSPGTVRISTESGAETFRLDFDPERLPWLGLWINRRGWSGTGSEPYLNLGLEPGTARHDLLSDAIAAGEADSLGAGETRQWSLRASLGQEHD